MLEAPPTTAPMDFADYLGILRRRLWVIILVTLLVVGGALLWSTTRESTYSASGELIIGSIDGRDPDVPTEVRVIQSQAVHLLALQKLGAAVPVAAIADSTSNGVSVEASSRNKKLAADSVNAHMEAYVQYLRNRADQRYEQLRVELTPQMDSLSQQIDALDARVLAGVPASTVSGQRSDLIGRLATLQSELESLRFDADVAGQNVDIVARATTPVAASGPKPREVGLIALGAGLLLGVLVAFLLEFLDDTIRTRQDLFRVTGSEIPIMGVIPAPRFGRREIISLTMPTSPATEAYRSLRTAVNFTTFESGRCVEITSARTRHGKTETLVNLAVLAAQAGQRVVVVDCDLRTPRVHEFFGMANDVGFTSVVYGESITTALQRVPGVDRLFVLTSGPVPTNPAEVLASDRCRDVLASLQADDTLVLVDAPPLLAVTDAVALARSVGGVLLVAAARITRRKQLRQALDRLRQVDARLLGTVLYRADSAETGGFGEDAFPRERRPARQPAVATGDAGVETKALAAPGTEISDAG